MGVLLGDVEEVVVVAAAEVAVAAVVEGEQELILSDSPAAVAEGGVPRIPPMASRFLLRR